MSTLIKLVFTFTALLLATRAAPLAAADLPPSANLVWRVGEPTPAVPPLAKNMTLALKVKNLKSPGELVSWRDKSGRVAVRVLVGNVNATPSLMAELATDAEPTPLHLAVPLEAIGAEAAHDLVLRDLGYRLELFVDGVLVDEEWPFGSLLVAQGSIQIAAPREGGSITQVALWDRDLTDDELQSISGGRAAAAERAARYLGPEAPFGQYWRPRGLNTNVGDCMPFFHEGRFHLFYLVDHRHHGSKWGLGAHQWAHVSTTDLVHWEQHPLAVAITDPKEGSICTGSVFFHDETYYAFYAVRTTDGAPAPLCVAAGTDGIHFAKQPALGRLSDSYNARSARDPVVFLDKNAKLYHMLVTTTFQEAAFPDRAGCLAQLVSPDLKQWKEVKPFLLPGYRGEPECPDVFEWHGWHYLVFSMDGAAHYRMSRRLLGPWLRPKVDVFDGPQARVMKTAEFTGDRRLGAAFLATGGYAGDVVFREILQHKDGTLGVKWPAEMIPPTGEAQARPDVKVTAVEGLEAIPVGKAPKDFLLCARITPAADSSCFGLRIGAGEKMQGGFELRIEPGREKVGLCAGDASASDESASSSIYNVTGLDQPFDLELLVKGDVVDVCIDHRRTLVARLSAAEANLFVFAQNATVTFEKLEVRPLAVRDSK